MLDDHKIDFTQIFLPVKETDYLCGMCQLKIYRYCPLIDKSKAEVNYYLLRDLAAQDFGVIGIKTVNNKRGKRIFEVEIEFKKGEPELFHLIEDYLKMKLAEQFLDA